MQNPVIVGAVRTPIGRFRGTLSPISATALGAKVDITLATGGFHTLHPGDTYFGFVQGTGGNWIELFVIADHKEREG